MPFKKIFLYVFVLTSVFSCLFAQEKETVKVGAILSITGGTATFGQENVNGIKLALQKVQKTSKYKIDVIFEDDKSESPEAVNMIRKLISVTKVNVLLGDVTSTNTLAMAPIAQDARIPLITPAATNVKITTTGNFISRACFSDDFQGEVMAKFAVNELKLKKGLMVIDNSSDYSKGLAEAFRKEFLKLGGAFVSDEQFTYVQKDINFSTMLRKIKRAKPEVIFLPGYYQEVALIIKQAREIGIEAVFLGGDGWDSPKLFEIAGAGIKGNYMSSHFAPDDPDTTVQKFVKEYEATYKEKPGAMAALGYDTMGIIADALSRATSTSHEDINKAILATSDFAGVTGSISFDENRNARKAAVILETTSDGKVFKTRINP